MRGMRWGRASMENVGVPTPVFVLPSAYDINLRIVRGAQFPVVYIGPIRTYQQAETRTFDNYVIWWTAQVMSYIDDADTITKYQMVTKGLRTIKIDWRKGNTILASTSYQITL